MTISEAKDKLLSWLDAQVGYSEGYNNYNKYAQNRINAYGWDVQNQPWCDVFADIAYVECFGLEKAAQMTYQPVGGFSALCSASAEFYERNSAWRTYPEVGDQVFFYVSGAINHTGIVVAVGGGIVTTIEGNSSDAVRRNSYAIGASNIAGYGRPNWSIVAEPDSTDETAEDLPLVCTIEFPIVEYGDTGPYVAAVQAALLYRGYDPKWIDGEYGEMTGYMLRKFQSENGFPANGIAGEQTLTKLFE